MAPRMQRPRLVEVVDDFLNKRASYTTNALSSGYELISYTTTIAIWAGDRVLLDAEFYGRTTRRHQNLVRDLAAARGIEVVQI